MHESFDSDTVLGLLAELKQRDRKRQIFGANGHDYALQPPLDAAVVEVFERHHNVSLPDDYRYFITQIANGGAGPYYGVFPFGQHDDGFEFCAWEDGSMVGDLARPFPHVRAWNLPKSFWENAPEPDPDTPPDEEDKLWEEWDEVLAEQYWNPAITNGEIPICHLGCALRQWLVINGEQKGFVWNDKRADNHGVSPVHDGAGRQMTFSDWYMSWLNESLRKCG